MIKIFDIFIKQCQRIVGRVEKIQKVKMPKVVKTKNGRIIFLSKCAVYNTEKSQFIKDQNATSLLRRSGIKTP